MELVIAVVIAIVLLVVGLFWLIGTSGGLTTQPCARCHVEGGDRWIKERKVDNRLIREQVCTECSRAIFFSHRGVDWEPLLKPVDE